MLSRRVMSVGLPVMMGVQILLGGCAARVAPLTVQAFIVTRGKENVRLGLLSVNAAPEPDVRDALRELVQQIRNEDIQLRKQLSAASDQRDLDTVNRERVRLELANTENELARKDAQMFKLGIAVAQMEKLASLEDPGLRGAVASLADCVTRKSDEALQSAQRLRAENNRVQADAEYAKSMALNDLLIGMRKLTEKRIEGKVPANVLLNEFITFYSRDVFGEFPQERAAILKSLDATAVALQGNERAGQQRKQDELRLAINALKNAKVRLTQDGLALAAALEQGNKRILEIENLLDDAWSHERFFAVLPPPTLTTKTDADGLVTLELDRRERWVLWAHTERQTPEKTERYYWIVGAPPSSEWSREKPLFLSNDNLLEHRKAPSIMPK